MRANIPKGCCFLCDQLAYCRGYCAHHYYKELWSGRLPRLPRRSELTCERPGCQRPVQALRMCRLHYIRQREGRDLDAPIAIGRPRVTPVHCTISGCGRAARARTWCKYHYEKWRHTGSPYGREEHP